MKYSRCKEIHVLVKEMIRTGQWVVKSKSSHLKLVNETANKMLTVPQTPSDHRAVLNFYADVKRAGFISSRK